MKLPATFESLFRSCASRAYSVAIRLTRNPADAEDLVQDAAFLAYRGFASFTQGSNFRAWFLRILVNCYYSSLRREKTRPVTSAFEDTDLYPNAWRAETGPPLQGSDPAAQLLDKLATERIVSAVNLLPEEYRAVSTLFFMDDLSYKEIARVLECPVGTVRSRLHRGRKMLQARWATSDEDGLASHPRYRETA
ncbi:MAG TPA: sigma-70 family RNA polymerase sigma factor [Gemmatimonadales bacterium]|nr:sigma-70 family RNA polymerase sigma factor [Gemmatimonadales bacterium]